MNLNRQSAKHDLMRKINRALILHSLRTAAPLSRANLAERTGLTRSTISSLIDELLGASLVHEIGVSPSQGGRPGTLLELDPNGGGAIGVEISRDTVRVLLTDFVAHPRWEQSSDIDTTDPEEILTRAERMIEAAVTEVRGSIMPLGIGVGLAGLVNHERGVLKRAFNLGWRDLALKQRWQECFGLRVHVANEATIAALAEHYFGAAAGFSDFVYVGANATAIGGGLFIHGRPYHGRDGFAAEIGHMITHPGGPLCACGQRGCWEAVLRAASGGGRDASSLRANVAAAQQGDPIAQAQVDDVIDILSIGITNLANILNPELIVVGGLVGAALRPIMGALEAAVMARVTLLGSEAPLVRPSELGGRASVMGAVALVLDDILSEPEL